MSADEGAHRDAAWRRLPTSISGSVRAVGVEGGLLAAVLAAAGVLFHRGLGLMPSFDEGVYLAQTNALLHGQRLGTDVFAAQPPGFHGLLLAAAKIGGLDIDRMRLSVLAVALIGLLAAYLVGRELAGPAAGMTAAAALAVAPPYPTYAASVMADLPGTVIALLALGCLLAGRNRMSLLVVGGVLVAAAEWVKLDAFFIFLPALVFLRPRALLVAAGSALASSAIGFAVIGGSVPDVWRGAVSYHIAARSAPGAASNWHAVRDFFHPRQPFTWLVVAAIVSSALVRRRVLWPLWAAAILSALFLLWHKPLHDNHLVLLSVALAPVVGVALAPVVLRRPVVGLAVAALVVGGYVQETRRIDRNAAPLPAVVTWAAQEVDAHSSPSQLVVSDDPIVSVLAHRVMPGQVIDSALLRFDTGYLTNAEVLHAIDANHVPVVVAGRSFLTRPALLAAIAKRFPPPVVRDAVRVYAR